MELKDNPLLQQEDYAAGYKESIENLKNHPEVLAFDKLCYELFSSDLGKKFIECIKDRCLIPSLIDKESKNYESLVIWEDGYKDFARMILNHITYHEQRIKAGN